MNYQDDVDRENIPWIYRPGAIPHYYGDYVRQLFLAAAAVILFGAPIYTENVSNVIIFVISAAVVMVLAASLTTPKTKGGIVFDVVLAAVGLIFFQSWALIEYEQKPFLKFFVREGIAILFFLALYLSIKTLRGMLTGSIGKLDSRRDFKNAYREEDSREEVEEIKEKLDEFEREIENEVEHREDLQRARRDQELFQD